SLALTGCPLKSSPPGPKNIQYNLLRYTGPDILRQLSAPTQKWRQLLLILNSPYFRIRKYRWPIFVIMALLMLALAKQTLSYRPSVSVDDLSYASEETIEAKKSHIKAFGSPDSNLFYLEGMDFLSEAGINFLFRLEGDIRAEVPFIREVNSIIKLFPASVRLPLEEGSAEAARNQKWLKNRAQNSPAVANQLISLDGRKTLLVMDFVALPDKKQRAAQGLSPESPQISIGRALENILLRYKEAHPSGSAETAGLKIWSSGAGHIVYQQYSFYINDLSKTFILLALVMLLLIFFMLRSWIAFIGTLLIFVMANWLTIGLMSLLELTIDLTFLMIPVTIGVATAIGYSVHFYNHFKHSLQHTSVDTALSIAWLRCIRPISFTALTTMFSFLSLRFVPISAIQNIGYACLIEVLIIYILTMTLFPLLLSFTRFRNKHQRLLAHSKWAFSVQLEQLTRLAFHFRKIILTVAVLLFLLGLYYIPGLRANYTFSEFIGRENQLIKDLTYLEQSEFAPVGTVSIIVHNENGLFSAADEGENLARLENLAQVLDEIEGEEIIKRVFWLGDLIEDAARLRGRKDGITSVRSMAELNGLLQLSKRLSGFDGASWLTEDRKSLRILLDVKAFESQPFVDLTAKYRQRIEDVMPSAAVFFTGFIMDTSRGDLLMTQSFIKS
ncbi:MAG: MMPL family transporter, partial [Spirochaetota bacterium]